MQQRMIKDGASLAVLIDTAALAADTTPVGVDIRGYQCVEIVISVGAGGITFDSSNKVEFVLTAAAYDDTTGLVGSYANVATNDIVLEDSSKPTITTGIIMSLIVAHATATVAKFNYIGNAGALKLKADFTGTHSNGRKAPA